MTRDQLQTLLTLQAAASNIADQIASLLKEFQQIQAEITDHGALEPTACDNFRLIRGVDDDAEAILIRVGITKFADVAALTPEDVAELGLMLQDNRRISRQGWIEQAAILARGGKTSYSELIDARSTRNRRSDNTGTIAAKPSGSPDQTIAAVPPKPASTPTEAAKPSTAEVEPANIVLFPTQLPKGGQSTHRKNTRPFMPVFVVLAVIVLATFGLSHAWIAQTSAFGEGQFHALNVGHIEVPRFNSGPSGEPVMRVLADYGD